MVMLFSIHFLSVLLNSNLQNFKSAFARNIYMFALVNGAL